MQPVPVGVVGEIYIGGAGLARGYLNRAELTAERFIPHPYSEESGARLYRTGDLARYLEDGEIEYVGRTDDQVKVRGYRIELGEIEARLREHSRVSECVVVASGESDGQKRLVAYVVSEGEELMVNELRLHLKERLPEYMIPSQFVSLEQMPLTLHGKVDRRALPSPDTERPHLGREYLGPRTELERMLVKLWEQTLGVEHIGVYDNFFELGGDSIKGAILINKLQEWLGEYVYVVALFDAPTVSELAGYLNTHYAEAVARAYSVDPADNARQLRAINSAEIEDSINYLHGKGGGAPSDGNRLSPIMLAPRHRPLPLSFAQQRLWFLGQLEPNSPAYNIPLALRLIGDLNISALQQTLNEVIRRHETLRTRFALMDAQPVQVGAPELRIELPVIDLSNL
jgi:hypothetical protein